MGISDRRKCFNSFIRMDTTTWLSIAIAVITYATPALSSEPRVVCYYTNWSVYRPGTARFNPQNINPYLCTHLVYAFGGFTKDNTLKPFDKYQDIEKGGYAKFTGLKTYNKKLKTLLAIGGWNEGSSRFSPMVAGRDKRKEFVRNAIKFLRQNHFDGLDLDWEYPAFRDGGKPKDRENYAKLVRELREEFEREAEKTGKSRLLLTMAVPAGIEYIQKGFDVKTLNQYLDWMNLLTYDYHSAFEPAVNHHAPLYPLEEPNEYSVDNELNIDYTIKFYLEAGADPDKLVLGIPTYGRSYTLFNPDAVDIGSPADGPGEQGDATREKGYLAYYEICEALKPKTKKRSTDEDSEESSEEEEDQAWTVVQPNPKAMGPVAYRGNQWVGYDDIDIVKKKAEYVAENGLGGIMFWSIDNDDFRGACHGKPYPLIEAAKEAYIVKLGATDNAIVTDKPRSITTSQSNRRRNRPRGSTTTTTAKPSTVTKSNKRKSDSSVSSTTPSWNIVTPEPPTTPDPGSDFKCTDEGFFPHPRDCKKYFWCLDSGPSNLGIVAHQFTCPSGLFFNKAADSCDFARNVLCKKPAATTKAPKEATKETTSKPVTTTTRKPVKLSTKSSLLFRTTSTTTLEPEPEEEYEDDVPEDSADIDAEDPKVIKELIDLIKKLGGVEQLEKHLHYAEQADETSASTTTAAPFNKKLYQKVLERTKNKLFGPGASESAKSNSAQNSRRGPQNAGLELSDDKDKLLRKDRPQYTTINRSRASTSAPEEPKDSDDGQQPRARAAETRLEAVEEPARVGTTTKPLQYVNIRRARPTTSDTADDTASRSALFERQESIVQVASSSDNLDVSNARRENIPEYVTIRRQRPTTQEVTTEQYTPEQETETQANALEREISSPISPAYTSIIRTRSSTQTPEKIESPEPTTVLAVQISSLLNSPTSEVAEITVTEASEAPTTTTTTTTTAAPSSVPPRRQVVRRRGSTTTTVSPSSSSTQVSSRNYAFVRRRRPLNEITSDLDSAEVARKIRSTTPDSREVDGIQVNANRETGRRSRVRFQSRVEDSVPAEAAPVSRGQFRPHLSRDDVVSLTPTDVDVPQLVEKSRTSFFSRNGRFRSRTITTAADVVDDSEVSAATVEIRRPNIVPRGRGRFTPISTTQSIDKSVATQSTISPRRPTFARLTPRPFTRSSATTVEEIIDDIEPITQRIATRPTFGRARSSLPTRVSPIVQARKLPFFSSTTPEVFITDEDDETEISDDISLSESAIEEKEHDNIADEVQEIPKRRIVIKKLITLSSTTESTISTEAVPITDDQSKRKFRVIRRRPTSSTIAPEVSTAASEISSSIPRIRKIIRKKIKPVEDEPEIIAKSIGSLTSAKDTTTEIVANYGERSRPSVVSTTLTPTTISQQELDKVSKEISLSEIEKETPVDQHDKAQDEKLETSSLKESTQSEEKEISPNVDTETRPEVSIQTELKAPDISESKEEIVSKELPVTEENLKLETTTIATTQSTPVPLSKNSRLPYKPPKRLFTSTTESITSSSRTFSRKFNPGVYTSPSTIDSEPVIKNYVTRRPFSSRTFTRRPLTTARTTTKVEEQEYSDEELLEEPEEPESSLVLVPPSKLFTRKPKPGEAEEDKGSQEEEVPQNRFVPASRQPFRPRVINSNTFRSSTSTTELPKRPISLQNRTTIYNRFAGNKPIADTQKRVQNVPVGYSASSAEKSTGNSIDSQENDGSNEDEITTTLASTNDVETTTEDDDYLSITETSSDMTNSDARSTNTLETESVTFEMEIDNSTDDYLESTDVTTNEPNIQSGSPNTQTETDSDNLSTTSLTTEPTIQTTTDIQYTTTTSTSPPIIKTQYDKLFSVSRRVEVNSKIDKHRLNKKNDTTLIEEGKIMVEKKPREHKIGEVSRFSFIKIVEDDIPIYLTKLGHAYPIENPPDHYIRIDEARNARALVNFADAPRENLIASESMNEAYRHINNNSNEPKNEKPKGEVEHLLSDDFLKYINEDKKNEKSEELYHPQWQFVPAAYENDKIKAAKNFEVVTPRSMLTEPSTLPLEGLFKTDIPTARKSVSKGGPFLVYSASVSTQKEEADIIKVDVLKPESDRSIITSARGQEFKGAAVTEHATVKYPVHVSFVQKTDPSTTTTTTVKSTSPVIELLTQTTTLSTELLSTVTSTDASTTETVPEETTTVKSPLDTKRTKFAFPRRPIIKSNTTRPAIVPRPAKKNFTTNGNLFQKPEKGTTKTRFSANRSPNVPVDARKKTTTFKAKSFTTESPKTTTERKPYYKALRPSLRPSFVPRRLTTPAPESGDT